MSGKRSWLGRPQKSGRRGTVAGEFGTLLRAARQRRCLTLKDLSDATGGELSLGTISQYERGLGEPRLSAFLGLCAALGVAPAELLPKNIFSDG